MTKADLLGLIAEKAGLSKGEVDRFLLATLESIEEALGRGETVPLVGFGSFSVVERTARFVRNPRTGEEKHVPEHKAVKFKAGTRLKSAVNH